MKKTLILFCFSIATFVYSNALTCSNTFYNGDTVSIVLCADDYDPAPTLVGGDPTTFYADLPALDEYAINGHIEFETLMYDDFIVIRAEDANHNTLFNLGTFYGIQDICLYTPNIQYLAVDIYCYHGAVSSTSGFNLTIRPTEKAVMEQLAVMDRLGIGTSTPEANLHVVGDIRLSDEHHYMTMHPTGSFSTNRNQFNFNKPIRSDVGVFSSSSTSDLTLQTYNTPRMTILKDNGYVGIGTSTPQTTLHVNGNIRGNGTLGALTIETETGTTTIGAQGWSYSHFQTSMPRFYFYKPIVVGNGEFSCGSNADLKLQTFLVTQLTIKRQNGYVGIGTEMPTCKLDVVGKIHSDSISTTRIQTNSLSSELIQANYSLTDSIHTKIVKCGAVFVESVYGADYVFDNNYNLRSLQEVSSYIQENGHLPEIQSADDMRKNGVNMSDFQIQLLQKIEELTLYIIKQEARISELESRQK